MNRIENLIREIQEMVSRGVQNENDAWTTGLQLLQIAMFLDADIKKGLVYRKVEEAEPLRPLLRLGFLLVGAIRSEMWDGREVLTPDKNAADVMPIFKSVPLFREYLEDPNDDGDE
jgi:hypothetical protein